MQCQSVLLVGSTPPFVYTIGRILDQHGYGVVIKDWTDDLRTAFTDPPLAIVLDGSELSTVGWSLLGWLDHDPVARKIPILVCSDHPTLLPYAMQALRYRPGPVVASSLDRSEFLAKLSAVRCGDMLLERAR